MPLAMSKFNHSYLKEHNFLPSGHGLLSYEVEDRKPRNWAAGLPQNSPFSEDNKIMDIINVTNMQEMQAIEIKTQLLLLSKQLNDEHRQKAVLQNQITNINQSMASQSLFSKTLLQDENVLLSYPLSMESGVAGDNNLSDALYLDPNRDIKLEPLNYVSSNPLFSQQKTDKESNQHNTLKGLWKIVDTDIDFLKDDQRYLRSSPSYTRINDPYSSLASGNEFIVPTGKKSKYKNTDTLRNEDVVMLKQGTLNGCCVCQEEFEEFAKKTYHLKTNLFTYHQTNSLLSYKNNGIKKKRLQLMKYHISYQKYNCNKCLKTFSSIDLLKYHNEKIHFKTGFVDNGQHGFQTFKRKLRQFETTEPFKIQNKPRKCLDCSYVGLRLNRHVKSKHAMLKTVHRMKYQRKCKKCDYVGLDLGNLNRHVKVVHTKVRDLFCSQCDYTTARRDHLKDHERAVHTKVLDKTCDECDYSTWNKRDLNLHKIYQHREAQKYKCSDCDYSSKYSDYVSRHVKAIHTKVKDLKCVECDYTTSRSDSLLHHKRNQHKSAESNGDQADYLIRKKNKRHKERSLDHIKNGQCPQCEYVSLDLKNLLRHIKSKHDTVKDNKCHECEYSTSRNDTLLDHVRTKHSEEKNNVICEHCGFSTSYKKSLLRHIKTLHKDIGENNTA